MLERRGELREAVLGSVPRAEPRVYTGRNPAEAGCPTRLAWWRLDARPTLTRGKAGSSDHGAWGIVLIAILLAGPAWGAAARKQDPTGPLILLAWLPVILLVFVALEVVLWVLVPGPLLATARVIDRGRGRCLLFGLLTAVVTLAILSLSGRYPAVGQTLVPIVLGLVALGSLTGITAVTALLGQGVLDLAERSGSRALAVGIGSLLFGLVLLFPIVGQVLGLYFLLVGLGGALQALTRSSGRGK